MKHRLDSTRISSDSAGGGGRYRHFLKAGVLAVFLLTPTVVQATPMFMGLGDLPGAFFLSTATDVSADGKTVVGESWGMSGREAFRWTESTGMQGLGYVPGNTYSGATAVSADGQTVVGNISGGLNFIWTPGTGMQDPGIGIQITGISADGHIVIGYDGSLTGGVRWTVENGKQYLASIPIGQGYPGWSPALAMTSDGQTVVGQSSVLKAYRWTSVSGIQSLGPLPTGTFGSTGWGVAEDGKTVVGTVSSLAGMEAMRWTEKNGYQLLGDFPGGLFSSSAQDVSANGQSVVGSGTSELFGANYSGDTAFLWTEIGGMRSFKDVLENDFGLNLQGWQLTNATAISDDGLTVVGVGYNPSGQSEAWLARLGDPLPFVVGDPATKPLPGGISFASATGFNPDLPTIVLTHGWQPVGTYIDAATGQLSPFPLDNQATNVVDLYDSISSFKGQANIIRYQWPGAYTWNFPSALSFVESAGADLANQLTTMLPADYAGGIQFIGHSLGTMVNANAVNLLSSSHHIDQMTLLDPPLAVPGISQSYFYDALPNGTVEYVDNFYAPVVSGGFGDALPGAAPGFGGQLVLETHTGVHEDFYSSRVRDENGEWITAALPDRFAHRPAPETWIPGLLEYIGKIAAESWDAVVNKAKDAWEVTVDVGGKLLKVFVDATNQVIDVIGDTTEKVLAMTKDAVTGAIQAVVDTGTEIKTFFGNLIGKVLDLKESSPVVVKQSLTIPVDADLLTFDFGFVDVGDGDWVTLYFNDQLLWTFLGEDFINELMHATIPIGLYAGQTGDLYFALNNVGDPNAEVLISNMGFVGTRQESNPSVPEPGTLALLALGLVLLHLAARRHRPMIR